VVRFFCSWRSAVLTKQANYNEEAENGTKGIIPRVVIAGISLIIFRIINQKAGKEPQ